MKSSAFPRCSHNYPPDDTLFCFPHPQTQMHTNLPTIAYLEPSLSDPLFHCILGLLPYFIPFISLFLGIRFLLLFISCSYFGSFRFGSPLYGYPLKGTASGFWALSSLRVSTYCASSNTYLPYIHTCGRPLRVRGVN